MKMKKLLRIIGFLFIFFMVGCKNFKEPIKSQDQKMFFEKEVVIIDNESVQLPLVLENIENDEVDINVSNSEIVLVENCMIIPKKAGATTIKATFKEFEENLEIVVLPKFDIASTIEINNKFFLNFINGDNLEDYVVTTSNEKISYKEGIFTAISAGECVICIKNVHDDRLIFEKKVTISPVIPILKADSLSVDVDDLIEFTVENYSSLDELVFEVSNESILELDDENYGMALKPGRVDVTVYLKDYPDYRSSVSITVNFEEIKMKISQSIILTGDEFSIDFYNYDSDDEFEITIENEDIIKKIGEKKYLAINAGSTILHVVLKEDNSIKMDINIVVYPKEPIISIADTTMMVGKTLKISLINYIDAEKFTWQVSDDSVVEMNDFLITAKKSGTVVITATSKDNQIFASSVTIEVIPLQPIVSLTTNCITVGRMTRLIVNNIDELETNDLSKYDVTVSNPSIATYSDGMITGLALGETKIIIVSKENHMIKGEVELTVSKVGELRDENNEPCEGQLMLYTDDPKAMVHAGNFCQIKIEGAFDNSHFKWVSLDTSVATVNENGRLIAVDKGTTQIAAVSKTNQDVKGFIQVTVYGTPNVDYAARLVLIAAEEIGYVEGPNNDTKYGAWYNLNFEPWCAMFVSWCANQAGIGTNIIPKYCGCTAGMKWFKDRDLFKSRESGYIPKAGDIIFFLTIGEKTGSSHTGIVYAATSTRIYTIEGNTSDMCARRSYSISSEYIVGYGTPMYPEFEGEPAVFKPGDPTSGENLPTT